MVGQLVAPEFLQNFAPHGLHTVPAQWGARLFRSLLHKKQVPHGAGSYAPDVGDSESKNRRGKTAIIRKVLIFKGMLDLARYRPILHNLPYLRERRRALRQHMTTAEKRVWHLVNNKQLGHRIRRQHSIGNFIVDFYCPRFNLIIEIDGMYHDDPEVALYDAYREDWLREKGFDLIRFRNEEVIQTLEGVIDAIRVAMGNR